MLQYGIGWGQSQGYTTEKLFNRVVTVLVYLNDVGSGGETRFCDLTPPLDVNPKKGMALAFFPGMLPSASENAGGEARNVMHEGRPPVGCEKWIVQQWVWSGPYLKG